MWLSIVIQTDEPWGIFDREDGPDRHGAKQSIGSLTMAPGAYILLQQGKRPQHHCRRCIDVAFRRNPFAGHSDRGICPPPSTYPFEYTTSSKFSAK
jgi:hypothetical protein